MKIKMIITDMQLELIGIKPYHSYVVDGNIIRNMTKNIENIIKEVSEREKKEMLEITKEFHDTYEKLASEYTYETREDTKVFDINSNNGKLMYATVNEIVSPILKENKILRENAENNDKVVDNVNWENMLLKKKNKQLKEKVNKLEILIEILKLGVTLNQEQEDLLDKVLFGGDSNE